MSIHAEYVERLLSGVFYDKTGLVCPGICGFLCQLPKTGGGARAWKKLYHRANNSRCILSTEKHKTNRDRQMPIFEGLQSTDI